MQEIGLLNPSSLVIGSREVCCRRRKSKRERTRENRAFIHESSAADSSARLETPVQIRNLWVMRTPSDLLMRCNYKAMNASVDWIIRVITAPLKKVHRWTRVRQRRRVGEFTIALRLQHKNIDHVPEPTYGWQIYSQIVNQNDLKSFQPGKTCKKTRSRSKIYSRIRRRKSFFYALNPILLFKNNMTYLTWAASETRWPSGTPNRLTTQRCFPHPLQSYYNEAFWENPFNGFRWIGKAVK